MFEISAELNGDVNVIKLVGRLDAKTARDAEAAFAEATNDTANVVLDMSKLDYIASAGLRALKRLRSDTRAKQGSLICRGVQDNVMDVFEMTGFAAMLEFE